MKTKRTLWFLAALMTAFFLTGCEKPNTPGGNDDDDDDDPDTTELHESLKGTNYYVLVMDGETYPKIANKVVADLRPDDNSKYLYIWDATYVAGTSVGPNYFGEVEGWTSLVVSNVGWSGCGFFNGGSFDMTGITSDYVLHIGIKSKDNASHAVILYDDGGNAVRGTIGATPFIDNGTSIPVAGNFTRDGEWQTVEIPMSFFFNQGLNYRAIMTNTNVMAFLSGGVAGTTLDIDAMFIYKK